MIDKNIVRNLVEEWLQDKDYFLVDVEISPDNRIVVEIDHVDGVWIEDCVPKGFKQEFLRRISRAIGEMQYLCGDVEYKPLMRNGMKVDISDRHHILVQQEPVANILEIQTENENDRRKGLFSRLHNRCPWGCRLRLPDG